MVGPMWEKFMIVTSKSTEELLKTLLDRGWFVPPVPEVLTKISIKSVFNGPFNAAKPLILEVKCTRVFITRTGEQE
jgi:hypothetical protein